MLTAKQVDWRTGLKDVSAMIDRRKTLRAHTEHRPLRIGAVSYLNSKPLIEGLAERASPAELILDVPSRLADELASGWLDVALIPSVEALADPDYEIVSDACVAARGPVLSVKLYFRVPPGEVRSLALDAGSRTSAALSRILLAERYGVEPRLTSLPLGAATTDVAADAVLLIGDRAMHPPAERFLTAWDLGGEWYRWTGLPFVFAMWVTREGIDLGDLEFALTAARDFGVDNLAAIAAREAAGLQLTESLARDYLTQNLHFRLGSAERNGLKLFHRLASGLGLAPQQELSDVPTAIERTAQALFEPVPV
jgi:chorismate dehydratase